MAPVNISATEEINWVKTAATNEEIQLISPSSIKYDNKGILSVLTKYSKIDSNNEEILDSNIYLIQIDCDKRLFKDFQIKEGTRNGGQWKDSKENILIKKTIIKSCYY